MLQGGELTSDAIVQTWVSLRLQAWSLAVGAVLFGAVIGSMVRRVLDHAEKFDTKAPAAVFS